MFKVPERYRITDERYFDFGCIPTHAGFGNNGDFVAKLKSGVRLRMRASDGDNWEHVSVSVMKRARCPTWGEMCTVKNLFWGDEDLVVQMHPPASEYVNCSPYCLHLWRYVDTNDYCKTPHRLMVGA